MALSNQAFLKKLMPSQAWKTFIDEVANLVLGMLPNGSISTAEIADAAVTTAKIADTNVTTGKLAANAVTRAKMSTAAAVKNVLCNAGTVDTTGTVVGYCRVPATGTLAKIGLVAASNLATSDTNYITFTCTNVTQSKDLFAGDATENTKTTGGTAITADGLRYFTLTGTVADLNVTADDLIKVTATVTGTLANTVTSMTYSFDFNGTT